MHNNILDIGFSDTQSVSNQPAGLLSLVYTATGGETSFQKDELINATVINLSRDGLVYSKVDTFSITPKKEFIHYPVDADEDAGTIVFHPGLPPMEVDEDSAINYVPGGSTGIEVTEPLTLAEFKSWAKIEVDDDDALITGLITAARASCEGYVGLSFVSRQVTAILRNDLGNIALPYGPVGDIVSMYDGSDTEIISDNYTISGITNKRIVAPRTGMYWGAFQDIWSNNWNSSSADALKVTYNAGYSVLPSVFKTAIKMQCAWMYQHRGDGSDITQMSNEAKMILQPYRAIV